MEEFEQFSLRYKNGKLEILDQTLLPDSEVWKEADTPEKMKDFIVKLSVRGAPLIGVAAAMSLAQYSLHEADPGKIKQVAELLRSSRPTAVNLMFCIDAMLQTDLSSSKLVECAYSLMQKEVEMNARMAAHGASLISEGENILHHCNTGSLATPGVGTALGVIREAHRQGKNIHVFVDETRPLLQGGRLTTFELKKEGIPYTLITDSMAGVLMSKGRIQRVLVGADRIAMNGDFANKIGTYTVAVLAKFHGVPFHTVAPISTVDFSCKSGEEIEIEERKPAEVRGASGSFGEVIWAPVDAPTFNPAFDVTPGELLTSIVLDTGIITQEQIKGGHLKTLKN